MLVRGAEPMENGNAASFLGLRLSLIPHLLLSRLTINARRSLMTERQ